MTQDFFCILNGALKDKKFQCQVITSQLAPIQLSFKIHARTGFIVEGKLAFLYSVDENQRMQTTLTTYDNCTVLVIKLEERCVEESVER